MSEEFGRGMFLSSEGDSGYSWDFEVDGSGDLRTTENGRNEMEKDAAFRSARFLSQFEGRPLTPETENEMSGTAKGALEGDPRIRRVSSIRINQPEGNSNTTEIVARAVTSEGEIELVFEV